MSRVEDFDSFYRSTVHHALSVTYAVSGDRDATHDAVITAYRHAWRDWTKIRHRDPIVHVRQEAFRAVFLETRAHPIRHRHQAVGDKELIDALGELGVDSRRLIVLMTIGHADLDSASREVGVTVEEGIEAATTGLDQLERLLGLDLTAVERRITALGTIDLADELPEPTQVRRQANVGHKVNTVAVVAAAVALIIGGGLFSASGDVLDRLTDPPDRERLGAESRDALLAASGIGPDTLLTAQDAGSITAKTRWSTVGTDDDPRNETPFATCPTQRFATPSPVKVMVRTHESGGDRPQRLAQSIEVASRRQAAASAYRRLIQWFADCQHPRVELIDAYKTPQQQVTVLRLTSHRSPTRSFTVGFSQIGAVTNTVVYEVGGGSAPDVDRFAKLFNDSIQNVCAAVEAATCPNAGGLAPTPPPRTTTGAGFMAIVDLPPVARVDHVWVAVEAKKGATSTLCKEPQLGGQSRLFVMPDAGLPETFGVAQTVRRFTTAANAKKHVDAVVASMERCPKRNLSATVFGPKRDRATGGYSWNLVFEASKQASVSYRTAIVRTGAVVTQLTFTPDGKVDLGDATFRALAARAAQRLTYAP